jgi:lipopolysaccharide/colanic/teichoic acid biosynthesis glycosyltransferase
MLKRFFDVIVTFILGIALAPILLFLWILASIDTHSNGFFFQKRIGRFGKPFTIYKLRSMHSTTQKISKYGSFIRLFKIDEIPQLFNVLKGEMSIVGPRPDVEGYYDLLLGENKQILELKPGLTSEAAIKYVNEDILLSQQKNPLKYNDTIIFPDKVKMNLAYYYNHSFWGDLKIIWLTFLTMFKSIFK